MNVAANIWHQSPNHMLSHHYSALWQRQRKESTAEIVLLGEEPIQGLWRWWTREQNEIWLKKLHVMGHVEEEMEIRGSRFIRMAVHFTSSFVNSTCVLTWFRDATDEPVRESDWPQGRNGEVSITEFLGQARSTTCNFKIRPPLFWFTYPRGIIFLLPTTKKKESSESKPRPACGSW